MPDINNPEVNTATTASSAKPSTPPTPAPVNYPIEDLIENSQALTGHSKEAAVGALFNCKEKELTKDDFKKAIDEFLKRKVI